VVICFNENFITYINDNGVSIMPLVKGKKASSKKGFGENVKPQKQAVAIAYSEARRGKKGKSKKKKDTY
jgi:hypothetical protein